MGSNSARREIRRIEAFYEEAERLLALPDERLFTAVPDVSGWSIGQHLEHLAQANGRTLKGLRMLAEGKLSGAVGGPNARGWFVLGLRRIPRGRAQSPRALIPPDDLGRAQLAKSLARNRSALEALVPYLPVIPRLEGGLPHPRLGMLNARQWLLFVRIHSTHHLRIIRDIAQSQ